MNKKIKIITGIAILTSIELVLGFLTPLFRIGEISINLALIPIIIAAIFYGPIAGLFLGLVNGIVVIFLPDTMSFFFPFSPFGTIATCIIKTSLGGLLAGLISNKIKKRNTLSALISSITVTVINTTIFIIAILTIFKDLYSDMFMNYSSTLSFIFVGLIGINFLIELPTSIIFSIILTKSLNKIVY